MRDDAPPGFTTRAAACNGNLSARVLHSDCVRQRESLGSGAMDPGVVVSGGLEFFQDSAGGESGGVAVLAEMREEDMVQVGGCDFGDEIGCGLIGKVAVARENALLHSPRALLIILQQGLVMVRLNEDGIDAACRVHHLSRCVTEIGEDGEG